MLAPCTFCAVGTDPGPACRSCAQRLADFVLAHDAESLDRWWLINGSPSVPPQPITAIVEWDARTGGWEPVNGETRQLAAKGLLMVARGCLEQGHSALALFHGARAAKLDCDDAITVLLDPRIMRRGAERALRDLLFPG